MDEGTISTFSHAVLRECLTDLIENIELDNQLLDRLYGSRMLTLVDKHNIRCAGSQVGQIAMLLDVLATKDDEALDVLIENLKEQGGHSYVVDRLETSKMKILDKNLQGGGPILDASLTTSSVKWILSHLTPTILSDRSWLSVADALLHHAGDIYSVLDAWEQGKFTWAVGHTLERWISTTALGGDATLQALINVLNSNQLGKAADLLVAAAEGKK